MAVPGHELPEGWTEHSLGCKTFYYHKASNTTQEERPAPLLTAQDAIPSASQALQAAAERAFASAEPSAPPSSFTEASIVHAAQPVVPVIATPVAPAPAPAYFATPVAPSPEPASFATQAVAVQLASQAAAAMPAPSAHVALLRVFVPPPGLQPGQQLTFAVPPSGGQPAQPMTVTASEAVAAGSVITVQYPVSQVSQAPPAQAQGAAPNMPAPPVVPQPEVDMTQKEDERLARKSWALFVSGWGLLLCCGNVVAPLLWVITAGMYFCKPQEQRALRLRQRKPAVASLATCGALSFLGLVGILLAGSQAGLHHRHHGHHHHPDPTPMPTHFDPTVPVHGVPPPLMHSMSLGMLQTGHNHHNGVEGEGHDHGGDHHERDHDGEHGFFFRLHSHWHHQADGQDAPQKPHRFRAFLHRFFAGFSKDGDAAKDVPVPAAPLPVGMEGQTQLLHV